MQNVNIYIDNEVVLQAKTNYAGDFIMPGELVFTTAMTGYQEVITDPSFAGQIIVMTYPLIGNYGTNSSILQSDKVHAKGIIVQQIDNDGKFEEFLMAHNTVLIHSINTRELVKTIKHLNYPKCVISNKDLTLQEIAEYKMQINPNVFDRISTKDIKQVKGLMQNSRKIGIFDFGLKMGIVGNIKKYFEDIFILPFDTDFSKIQSLKLNCIMLSNGPGDPDCMQGVIDNIRRFIGKIDIYGICLGHQLLGLALGCKTRSMNLGHRGANHPVINTKTGHVIITSQNHGYEIIRESLPSDINISYVSVHDGSIEGIESEKHRIKSVQFHPEAMPGPSDAKIVFAEWFCEEERRYG